jgi:hypothetical protein
MAARRPFLFSPCESLQEKKKQISPNSSCECLQGKQHKIPQISSFIHGRRQDPTPPASAAAPPTTVLPPVASHPAGRRCYPPTTFDGINPRFFRSPDDPTQLSTTASTANRRAIRHVSHQWMSQILYEIDD